MRHRVHHATNLIEDVSRKIGQAVHFLRPIRHVAQEHRRVIVLGAAVTALSCQGFPTVISTRRLS